MIKIYLPRSYLSLLAIIGLGVVLAGSGFQGMSPNQFIAGSGVVIIFGDMYLWITQQHSSPHKKHG